MKLSSFTAYVKQLWKNKPDTSTPLSAERLTHMEEGIKGNSDRGSQHFALTIEEKPVILERMMNEIEKYKNYKSDFIDGKSWAQNLYTNLMENLKEFFQNGGFKKGISKAANKGFKTAA